MISRHPSRSAENPYASVPGEDMYIDNRPERESAESDRAQLLENGQHTFYAQNTGKRGVFSKVRGLVASRTYALRLRFVRRPVSTAVQIGCGILVLAGLTVMVVAPRFKPDPSIQLPSDAQARIKHYSPPPTPTEKLTLQTYWLPDGNMLEYYDTDDQLDVGDIPTARFSDLYAQPTDLQAWHTDPNIIDLELEQLEEGHWIADNRMDEALRIKDKVGDVDAKDREYLYMDEFQDVIAASYGKGQEGELDNWEERSKLGKERMPLLDQVGRVHGVVKGMKFMDLNDMSAGEFYDSRGMVAEGRPMHQFPKKKNKKPE